jgi:hypothetical protein
MMRERIYALGVFLLAVAASAYFLVSSPDGGSSPIATVSASPSAPAACTFPTMPAATPEETAWQLFVAANCAANKTQVVWETWIEQGQLYPANGSAAVGALERPAGKKRLHGSPLARATMARTRAMAIELIPSTECNVMNGPPPNVKPNAIICEEARLNPAAQSFVSSNGYQTRPPQTKAAQQGTDIEFPGPAIEVKVDWIPGTDFTPPFTCSKPPQGVHVEMIAGTCYAMAGMHISSKLLKDWIWVTFEPQSMLTNPLRCITFGPCNDPWGSNPATSDGGPNGLTNQTPALAALMKQANLSTEFSNYRLDGAQITFTNADGTPTFLGNSVIEGENVGMTKNTASCITCHSVSSIKNDGTDGITVLNNQVGPQYQVPAGWIARDFAWSLGLACPTVPNGGGLQTCTAPANAVKKGRKTTHK